MAVSVVTVSTVARAAAATDVVITKPTGLAVGDLMVAFLSRTDNDQTSRTWTPPASWSTIQDVQGNDTATSSSGTAAFYKIANSGDAAATNFTFVCSGASDALAGVMYRISGHSPSAPNNTSFAGFQNNDETPTFSATITPTFADCLLLMHVHHYAGSSTSKTTSGYAITTSNPSWTEAYDDHNSTTLTIGGAYANRPQVTATGDATFTSTGDNTTDCAMFLVAIKPIQDVNFAASVIQVAAAVQEPSTQLGVNLTAGTATATASVVTPTISEEIAWSNQSKSSATWTNQDKSP